MPRTGRRRAEASRAPQSSRGCPRGKGRGGWRRAPRRGSRAFARGVGEGHVRAELGGAQREARCPHRAPRRAARGVGEVLARCRHAAGERLRGRPGVLPGRLGRSTKRYNLRANAVPGIPERVRQRRPRTSHPSARVRGARTHLRCVHAVNMANSCLCARVMTVKSPSVCNHGHNYEPGSRRQ